MQAGFRMPRQKVVVHFWCITIKHLNVYRHGKFFWKNDYNYVVGLALAGKVLEPEVILNMYT